MTRQKLRNDIRLALRNTWLGPDTTLTTEQRTVAEQQIQKLADGVADAVDSYVAEELGRLKGFLVGPGAYTGHFVPTYVLDAEDPRLLGGRTLTEEIVTIDPGSIRDYTPSSG